jgi:hypothetical protein
VSGCMTQCASGRVENTRSFARNSGSPSHCFVQKRKPSHAAAGKASVQVWYRARTGPTT